MAAAASRSDNTPLLVATECSTTAKASLSAMEESNCAPMAELLSVWVASPVFFTLSMVDLFKDPIITATLLKMAAIPDPTAAIISGIVLGDGSIMLWGLRRNFLSFGNLFGCFLGGHGGRVKRSL